jgi:hypothetical protein
VPGLNYETIEKRDKIERKEENSSAKTLLRGRSV